MSSRECIRTADLCLCVET